MKSRLLLMAVLLAGCTARPTTDQKTPQTAPEVKTVKDIKMPPEQIMQALLKATNAARSKAQKCGNERYPAVPALVLNVRLIGAAQTHADDMAKNDFFAHEGSDDSDVSVRALRFNYNYRMVGENIAAGYPDVQATVDGWVKSPGHCRNLMNPDFKEIGFGYAEQKGTEYGKYWVQVFGVQRK